MESESFSFLDLDRFETGTPHGAFARLRRESPIHWHSMPSVKRADDGFWLLTKYRDIVYVSKNPALFCSNLGTLLIDHPPAGSPPPWSMVKSEFCSLDPPVHGIYRRIIAPSFTARAVAAMEAELHVLVNELFDGLPTTGECDFAESVAVPFPVNVVLGQLLGLPPGDREKAAYWSDVLSAPEDPHFRHTPDAAIRAVNEMYDYALKLVRDRRANPRGDLASVLAHAKTPDGSPISDDMFTHYFWSMVLGSFDTTASCLAGGVLAFLQFPDQYERLLSDPSLLASAVEEILRWVSPVIYFRRTATADTELGGKRIRCGDRVALCYPSANRDEDAFENPDVFDITRAPNDHLSFGFGPHFCLGARLARLELSVVFGEMVKRRARMEARGTVRWARSNFLNRIKTLPVAFTNIDS